MHRISAGILFYRFKKNKMQVLLVHPGGPYWVKKDAGAWSIPKGEAGTDEKLLEAAIRETEEETGIKAQGKFIALTPVKQKSGKIIYAWALEESFDETTIKSNTFEIEWSPKSGKKKTFPEIDKAAWFDAEEAMSKMITGQVAFITELESRVNREP
jgi:predicted NUDIX family NTP pyrophosphohydrolase